jgi:hypothetical protein
MLAEGSSLAGAGALDSGHISGVSSGRRPAGRTTSPETLRAGIKAARHVTPLQMHSPDGLIHLSYAEGRIFILRGAPT